MSKKKGCTQKKEPAKDMEITKEEADKLNKELAKTRQTVKKETIKEKEDTDIEKIKEKMKDPSLLVDTIKEIQKEVAGEEDTILAEIIITSTRLVKNAIPESTNFLLSDKTGVGKDLITKKTLKVIIPEEEHLHVTKMSPEAFTYWHYKDKDWTWDRKVIHLEDVTQQLLNCPTFKTMSSGGSFAVIVKDQQTLEIPTPGKPCMILTSHHANPKDEALRRFRIGSLNETKDQTQKVKDNISRQYTGEAKIKPDYILRSAVQSLDPYFVMIPYARIIQHFFPDDILMRTHYHCFLDYICGSAIFHQYQREKTEKGEIIATPDDYMIARMVLIYTTSNPKMIPMSEDYREISNILENNVDPMTVHDIFLKCNQSERWLYRHLPEITKTGLIVKNKKGMEDSKKPVTTYQFSLELNASAIPTWNKITRIMDEIYKKTVKTDKCVKCSNPPTEVEKLQNYICQALSNVSNEKERKRHMQQLTGLSNVPNGKELTQMTELSMFLCERDEKRYRKYYKEFIPTEEKSNQKTLNTSQNEESNSIDLSKYEMIVRRVEDIVGSEKLPALQIARRMKKTNIKEMGFIEGILKQAVADSSFETTLRVDPEGNYSNKNMEESNGK